MRISENSKIGVKSLTHSELRSKGLFVSKIGFSVLKKYSRRITKALSSDVLAKKKVHGQVTPITEHGI